MGIVPRIKYVVKRDGSLASFDVMRIYNAVKAAMIEVGQYDKRKLEKVVKYVVRVLNEKYGDSGEYPHVEEIQDIVELALMKNDLYEVAKAYILYRKERERIRKEKMKILGKDRIDEVDKAFSLNAIRLLAARYLMKDENGRIVEGPKDLFKRVAALVVIPDILYDEKIFDKEGKQKIHPTESFDPVEYEGKLGLGKYEGGFEFVWNKYHLERMKSLYDELNSQGKMKVSWSEFLKMLSQGEFENYANNVREYYEIMVSKKFMPNSPTLFNAGARLGQLSACFVLDIDDDMESIMKAAHDAAIIFKSGGGIGINYSKLRPEGDVVASTGGIASGPISFMKLIDAVTEVIKQGGRRRGACMGILEIWHPDIEKFIIAKSSEGVLTNHNISVMIDEKFWRYLEKNEDYPLVNPRNGKVWKYVKPRDLFRMIAEMAWRTGDPGVLFKDNINRHNILLSARGEINTTNPCVTGDTLVLTDRGLLEARELKEGIQVWTLEGWRTIEKVFNNGIKDVYEIELKNGLRLKVTKDHKLLTDNGWKKVEELREGERIRIVLECPERYGNANSMHEGFAEFLGFWVGDGSLSVSDHVRLHVGKEVELAEYFNQKLSTFAGHSFVETPGQ